MTNFWWYFWFCIYTELHFGQARYSTIIDPLCLKADFFSCLFSWKKTNIKFSREKLGPHDGNYPSHLNWTATRQLISWLQTFLFLSVKLQINIFFGKKSLDEKPCELFPFCFLYYLSLQSWFWSLSVTFSGVCLFVLLNSTLFVPNSFISLSFFSIFAIYSFSSLLYLCLCFICFPSPSHLLSAIENSFVERPKQICFLLLLLKRGLFASFVQSRLCDWVFSKHWGLFRVTRFRCATKFGKEFFLFFMKMFEWHFQNIRINLKYSFQFQFCTFELKKSEFNF